MQGTSITNLQLALKTKTRVVNPVNCGTNCHIFSIAQTTSQYNYTRQTVAQYRRYFVETAFTQKCKNLNLPENAITCKNKNIQSQFVLKYNNPMSTQNNGIVQTLLITTLIKSETKAHINICLSRFPFRNKKIHSNREGGVGETNRTPDLQSHNHENVTAIQLET